MTYLLHFQAKAKAKAVAKPGKVGKAPKGKEPPGKKRHLGVLRFERNSMKLKMLWKRSTVSKSLCSKQNTVYYKL